ncbi:TBP-associated factor 4 [Pseudozyma hubeiensis]|nr:TBP-associated factor 4 [Pseudozyma hubeiensis]
MASSPAASSPLAARTTSNDASTSAQHAQSNGSRERSNSSAPLAKRFKPDHTDASTAGPSINSTSNLNDAGTAQLSTGPKPAAGAAGASEQKDNFDSLVDVMGASGVDLQAEEEAIQRRELMQQSQNAQQKGAQPDDDDLFLQMYPLAYKVHTLAQQHGLSVDAAVLNYLSLAARTRLKNMLETMIASSRHRSWSSHQHPPPLYPSTSQPMYHEHIISDPVKQLAALEKAERGQEARRRRERLARDQESSALAPGYGGDDMDMDDGTGMSKADGRKRPKKMGPGVAARNMSEDVRKRLADSTAMRNLGGGSSKYSWLSGGSSFPSTFSPLGAKKGKAEAGAAEDGSTPSRLPKPKFAPQPSVLNWGGSGTADNATGTAAASTTASTGAWGDVAARQAAKEEEERQARLKVTLRDALFALEYERKAGVGYGSGETLLYRIRAGGEQMLKAKET